MTVNPYFVEFVPEDGTWAIKDLRNDDMIAWAAFEETADKIATFLNTEGYNRPGIA